MTPSKTRRLARRVADAPTRLADHLRLRRVVKRIRSGRDDLLEPQVLTEIREAWGNTASTADVGLLGTIVKHVRGGSVSFLECGSGLTTFVLQLAAEGTPIAHTALEDNERWAKFTQSRLRRFGLSPVVVCSAPLRSYGDFDWYDTSVLGEQTFDFVICDGPRAAVARGGRVGLLLAAKRNIADGAIILLDDVNRPSEASVIANWEANFSVTELRNVSEPSSKSFALLQLPGSHA